MELDTLAVRADGQVVFAEIAAPPAAPRFIPSGTTVFEPSQVPRMAPRHSAR